jgi:hypothetical protein
MMRRRLGYLLIAAVVTGCGGGPTSSTSLPDAALETDSGTAIDSLATGAIHGRIVDTLTGEPIAKVRVEIPGMAQVETRMDGTFSFDFSGAGRVSFHTEGRHYWRRETHIEVNPAASVELDMLPDSKAFDLRFFDHVFRDRGRSGTHPWREEPLFEIWSQSYTCSRKTSSGACEELEATGTRAPRRFMDLARRVIVDDTELYTGGQLNGLRIVEHQHVPGTRVPRSEFLQAGKVSVAFVDKGDDTSWAFWRYYTEGAMHAGHIQINARHKTDRGVYSHELAHILGFDHPEGLDAVPLRSIMRRGHGAEPTPADILHGRILYERPAGSRTPDKDPEDYTLNARIRLGIPCGPLVTRARQ